MPEINWPKVEKFLSDEEVRDDLISRMDEAAKKTWRMVDREDLIKGHHSTGMAIRNEYHLWHPENPHSVKAEGLHPTQVANHQNHPDQRSMRIMEMIWDKLNAKD